MRQSKKIKVGLVGTDYVSTHHLRAPKTLDCVEVVGIADLNFKLAQQVAKRFGVPTASPSLTEMAQVRPEVIHSPPALHCSLVIED